MPELPEVETTRRGIAPHLEGQRISRVIVRDRRLRWPIPEDLDVRLSGQKIVMVERRAKYLLIHPCPIRRRAFRRRMPRRHARSQWHLTGVSKDNHDRRACVCMPWRRRAASVLVASMSRRCNDYN